MKQSKYQPLKSYLHVKHESPWRASFAEIEVILGSELPQSAHSHQAWWANESDPTSHVQKHAWLDEGWKTENLDLERRLVTFRKNH